MFDLTAIQEELQDLNALIARHERTLAAHTEAKSLRANIQTLKRRRQVLEDDIAILADDALHPNAQVQARDEA